MLRKGKVRGETKNVQSDCASAKCPQRARKRERAM